MENDVVKVLLDIIQTFVLCLAVSSGIVLFIAGIFELAPRFTGE